MKIERYEVVLNLDGKKDPFWSSPARGCIMHGVLMSSLKDNALHSPSSQRPFTQYLLPVEYGQYVWTINIIDTNLGADLLKWLHDFPSTLSIHHYGITLNVSSVARTRSVSYDEILDQALGNNSPRELTLDLITPTCFKKAGQNQAWPLPEPRLLVQSSLKRWNAFTPGPKFVESDILDSIEKQVAIKNLNIQSRRVAMDGINFVGSIGQISLTAPEDSDTQRILALSLAYGEYAGFGAKTAMGLGAARLIQSGSGRNRDGAYRQRQRQLVEA